MLGLEPLDRPEEILGPSPAEFGELGHEILKTFYRALIDGGYFTGKANGQCGNDVASRRGATPLPTMKGNQSGRLSSRMGESERRSHTTAASSHRARFSRTSNSGFAPVSLETAVTGRLPADWPEPLNSLAIRGRMDRIDRNDARSARNRLQI